MKMKTRNIWLLEPALVVVITLSMFFLSGCLTTSGAFGGITLEGKGAKVQVGFSDRDRQVIADYYTAKKKGKGKKKGLPPGLAKRDELPPGLQRQVQKNGKLPKGLRTEPLPYDLRDRLPPVPEGFVRARVGVDIVLMNVKTRLIVDVMKDIAF
jgi:hypothetical protein